VFSNGWVANTPTGGPVEWWVYYGAADSGVGLAMLRETT
jgi:predicted GH43/DUF377 family glycosyl hydrolase